MPTFLTLFKESLDHVIIQPVFQFERDDPTVQANFMGLPIMFERNLVVKRPALPLESFCIELAAIGSHAATLVEDR